MDNLIDRQALDVVAFTDRDGTFSDGVQWLLEYIDALPSADVIEVVRCKDCKHRPTGEERDDLEFPDDKCPCKCEDYWYSWKPSDNWFCGNGERKDNNYDKR